MVAKSYSPLRRWLRAERAREHLAAIAADVETVQEMRPSRAPALEVAARAQRLNRSIDRDRIAAHQDDTSTDETVYYTGAARWG